MININVTILELSLGIGITHKLRSYGFTQFEGFTRVSKSFIGNSVTVECFPTESDLLTMNFDKIKKELKK